MELLHAILESPWVHRLGWALLHSLWEGAAVAAAFAAALVMLRKRGPSARYAAALAALLALAVLPAVTFLVLPSQMRQDAAQAGQNSVSAVMPVAFNNAVAPIESRKSGSDTGVSSLPASSPAPSRSHPLPPREALRDLLSPTLPWLVLAWAVGVLALSLWNFGGWVAVQQLTTRTTRPVPQAIEQAARKLAQRLGLNRSVRLLESGLAQTPMVLGALRPVVLLPVSVVTELSVAELESLLAHELAHVLRHDYLVNLLQSVVETLLFYHPAVWWVSHRIRIERELCCDDLVVTLTKDRATYARALAAVALVRPPMLVAAASGGKLLPRLRRIMGSTDAAPTRPGRWAAGAAVVIAAAGLILAARLPAGDKTNVSPDDADVVHVRGRVLDAEGRPVSGAHIAAAFAWPNADAMLPRPMPPRATTDARGRFEIIFRKSDASGWMLSTGQSGAEQWKKTTIIADADGYGLAWDQWDRTDPAGDVVLKLVPDLPIEGRVIDLEGRPVAGVKVTPGGIVDAALITMEDYQKVGPKLRIFDLLGTGIPQATPAISDPDGRFRFTGLGRDRSITLYFDSPRIAAERARVVTRAMQPVTRTYGPTGQYKFVTYGAQFTVTAAPARSITGTVRDATTHRAVSGARVEGPRLNGWLQQIVLTDARGMFRIDGVSTDQSGGTLTIIPPPGEPYLATEAQVLKTPGLEPLRIDFELHKGVWVEGKITDKTTGSPVPAQVAYSPFLSNPNAKAFPEFELNGGSSWIRGGWHMFATGPDGTYRVPVIPGRGIVGVQSGDPRYAKGAGAQAITETRNGGSFKTYQPWDSASTFNAVRQIDALPQGAEPRADFQLEPGPSLQIEAVDASGKPVRGLLVTGCLPPANRAQQRFDGNTFDITGFASPSDKRVVIILDQKHELGKAVIASPGDSPGRPLKIRLEPTATLTGRLVTPDGDPIKNGRLRVDSLVPALRGANTIEESGNSGSDGRFVLRLAPGLDYVIRGSPDPFGGRSAVVTDKFTAEPGRATDLGDVRIALNPQ